MNFGRSLIVGVVAGVIEGVVDSVPLEGLSTLAGTALESLFDRSKNFSCVGVASSGSMKIGEQMYPLDTLLHIHDTFHKKTPSVPR